MTGRSEENGRWVRTAESYQAFMPDPLPPVLAWTPCLLKALSEADRVVGRLAGEGRRLPNPHMLIRPFLRREAVLSSRIEGTQATLGELLAAEAGAAVERSPEDLREVGNYVAALEHGVRRLAELPLSLRLVRELHTTLMEGVRGGQAAPGEFRRTQNWIGTPGSPPAQASYVPPPPQEMETALHAWEAFLHDDSLPPLVQAALIHYQFEAIHPFLDGNGRVGRLLITLFMLERRLLPSPLLYLSAYFEASRPQYYERLLGVSLHGQWAEWLTYFLEGVRQQAQDALARAEHLNEIRARWREAVAGQASRALLPLLDLLGENPFWTVPAVAGRLGVAYTTAQRALEKLEALGIVAPLTKARRDRVYFAREAMEALERPIVPAD